MSRDRVQQASNITSRRNQYRLGRLGLGTPLFGVRIGVADLSIHQQVHPPSAPWDLTAADTVWLVESCACGGAAIPVTGEWIEPVLYRCNQRSKLRLTDERAICGPLPVEAVKAEAIASDGRSLPVHVGGAVFLLVAPRSRDIVVRLYDSGEVVIREYAIPRRSRPGALGHILTRLQRLGQPPMPPPGYTWHASWWGTGA